MIRTVIWHDDQVRVSSPPLPARGFITRRRRLLAIAMLLLIVPTGYRVPAGQGIAHHFAR